MADDAAPDSTPLPVLPDGGWTQRAGIGATGAVLVRPDRVVAWRSQQRPGAAEFERGLRAVIGR